MSVASLSEKKIGVMTGLVGGLAVCFFEKVAIDRSTSSTAAIGYIFLPVLFAFAFYAFFCWSFLASYVWRRLPQIIKAPDPKVIGALILFLGSTSWAVKEGIEGIQLTRIVAKVEGMKSDEQLAEVLGKSYGHNKFVLGAVAGNPSTSGETLKRIAELPDPSLHERMGSIWPLMRTNPKGLAVMRLVALNFNVSSETLERLAASSQSEYVLGDIAGNENVAVETLKRLETKKNYLIDWGLAQNRNIPEDLQKRLLEREKYFTQRTTLEILLRNPNIDSNVRKSAEALLKAYK